MVAVAAALVVPGMDGVPVLLLVVLVSSIVMYTLGGSVGSPADTSSVSSK